MSSVDVRPELEPATVAARTLVPTSRQLQDSPAGTTAAAWTPSEAARRSRIRTLTAYLRDLDPRHVIGPRRTLVVLALLLVVTDVDQAVFSLALPDLRAAFQASTLAVIVLPSLLLNLGIILRPLFGYLSDRVPRVVLLRIAFIGKSLALTLTAFAGNLGQLVLGMSGSQLINQVQGPSQQTLVADAYQPESRGRVLALLPAMTGLGLVISPLVAGVTINLIDWRGALLVLGTLSVLVSLSSLWLREPVRGAADRAAGVLEADEETIAVPGFADGYRALNRIATVKRIWWSTPFLAGGAGAVNLFLGLYWVERFGLTTSARSILFALGGAVSFIGFVAVAPLIGRLLVRQPGRVMALTGTFYAGIVAGCLIVLQLSHLLWLSVIASLPLQFAFALFVVAPGLVLVQVVPAHLRGLGVTSTAPWQMLTLPLLLISGITGAGAGLSAATIVGFMVPAFIIGGLLFASGAAYVTRDVRSALAAVEAARAVRQARQLGRTQLLLCRSIEVNYDGAQVLFGVDFDVATGEIVALVGTNGAGKSTLLRAIAGTQPATAGAVLLDGQDVSREPAHVLAARGVVMVPGGHAIFPDLSVLQNLTLAGWLHRGDQSGVRERIDAVLAQFPQLGDKLDRQAGNLSGGEQQMIALGQAFIMQPRLLLIDELSLGLAPAVVERLLDVLRDIHAGGTTIVMVEQSINVALTVATRAVFLEKGRVRFDGPTAELLDRPELVRAVFMGGTPASTGHVAPRAVNGVPTAPPVLHVLQASVSYGGVSALRDVDLTVAPGEIVGVLGPNGAGKTTLFDVISGFVDVTSGTVSVNGEDVSRRPPDARARGGLGRAFQNARLFPSMTVRENIAVSFERLTRRSAVQAMFWVPALRESESRVGRKVEELVDLMGLNAYADKFVSELSTGTRRAVEMACVMAAQPQVLLLDEPSSGLAQAEVEAMGPLLQRLVKDTGCGLLVIEHDLPLLLSMCDRLVAMELGRVLISGAPHDVLADPAVMRAYLNASPELLARSGSPLAAVSAAVLGDQPAVPSLNRNA